MDQEFKFFNALNQAKTYKINTKGQLEITTTQGTLVFQSPTALDDAKESLNGENTQNMTKLEGTSWIFIGFAANNQLIPPLKNTTLTLEFDKDSLSGTGGCNRYMGGYKLENGKIIIPPLASTKMACPPPIMDQEFKFFNALNQAKTYKINTKGQLEITTAQGTLVFQSPTALDDARSWLDQEKPQNWNQAGVSSYQ
jgi:heat shock protein HslJ